MEHTTETWQSQEAPRWVGRLTRGNEISSSEFIALSSFLEIGKLGGRKYRKQFLNKKEGRNQSGTESVGSHHWSRSGTTTHRRIWTRRSMVSWLVLGAVVSGSMGMQSEVEGSTVATACWATKSPAGAAATAASSLPWRVSGRSYSGDGGFINRTSSLPFSTLERTQCLPHVFRAPRRAACPCPGQLSTHLPGRGVTSGLLVLCPWAHSQISPSTASHSCPPPQL